MTIFLEIDDLFQLPDFDNGDSVALPELLPSAIEQSEEAPSFHQGGGWNPYLYLSQEEQNLLGISSNYDNSNTITSAHISSGGNLSSFSPLSPTVSYNSQFQADSSVSVFPPTLVMPTTSTDTHTNLHKTVEKKAGKEEQEQEEAVMFILKSGGKVLYDGYSWRKYGEKRIKQRNFPRSYYRCGHDGCKVKKHVERSSVNPAEVFITYYGRHNHHPITKF